MPELNLTDPQTIERLLGQHGVIPSRSSGQNFLICAEPLEVAVNLAAEGPGAITELGPGYGPLTLGLLGNGRHVRAIEQDEKLAGILKEITPPELLPRLELQIQDMREADWTWSEPYQIFGNIPYNLSGLVLRRLTQLEPAPHQAVLMVQREVAERLTAGPPDLSLLGLSIQLWGEASIVAQVPATCFWPAPEVSSSLVLLTPSPDRLDMKTREAVLELARAAFQTKRKQLGGSLTKYHNLSREQVAAALKAVSITPNQRPQELTPKQWIALFNHLDAVSSTA